MTMIILIETILFVDGSHVMQLVVVMATSNEGGARNISTGDSIAIALFVCRHCHRDTLAASLAHAIDQWPWCARDDDTCPLHSLFWCVVAQNPAGVDNLQLPRLTQNTAKEVSRWNVDTRCHCCHYYSSCTACGGGCHGPCCGMWNVVGLVADVEGCWICDASD